jgi:hypothetical protein
MSNEKALVDAANRVGFAIQCDHEGMPYPRVEKSIESLKAAAILYAEEKIAEQIAAWLEAHFDDDEYQGDYPSTSQRNHDQYKLAAAIREGRWRK